MADEEIEGMNALFKNIDRVKMTRKEKSKVVEAGAKIVEDNLKKDTKEAKRNPATGKLIMDFKKSKGGRYEYQGVLEDGVTHKPNEFIDGSTNIGFKNGYVTIAHWFNDGTYRQPGTHFLDKSFAKSEESSAITAAQQAKAIEIINKKGL